MAKETLNPMGLDSAELNALMSVQVNKMDKALKEMKQLLERNNCSDFATAYTFEANDEFLRERDKHIDELRRVIDVMEKLRTVQHDLRKKGD